MSANSKTAGKHHTEEARRLSDNPARTPCRWCAAGMAKASPQCGTFCENCLDNGWTISDLTYMRLAIRDCYRARVPAADLAAALRRLTPQQVNLDNLPPLREGEGE